MKLVQGSLLDGLFGNDNNPVVDKNITKKSDTTQKKQTKTEIIKQNREELKKTDDFKPVRHLKDIVINHDKNHVWKKNNPQIIITNEFDQILNLIEFSNFNIYISGVAGTGKSTLLGLFKLNTKKNYVILAPTGIAALNVGGATIHSFFRFPIEILQKDGSNITYNKKRKKIYQRLSLVIIDEISMVRADILDGIDYLLRMYQNPNLPFGGVQIVCFGDVLQLPPVVNGKNMREYFAHNYGGPYFFNADSYVAGDFIYAELTKVFRQKDEYFVNILNKVRYNNIDNEVLLALNNRYKPEGDLSENVLTLCSTNSISSEINESKMAELTTKSFSYEANIEGEFDSKYYPTEPTLVLKEGAQIMMIKNDNEGRWVNGTIGKVTNLADDRVCVEIKNKVYEIDKYEWKLNEYVYDQESNTITSTVVGTFTQYPVQLSWAITIHKSQGQTYDKVNINLGKGAFAPGQVYVALSRCKSFEGITLQTKIRQRDIFIDKDVSNFIDRNKD